MCSTRKLCNKTAVSVISVQPSLLCLCHDKPTWKPAPPPCWETQFGSGGTQLLIRYLLSWYSAKPSLTREIHLIVYPTSLHGSLSPAETSSFLWLRNQWQTQLMSQQLTVVNEHNKAPQVLYQLHLLLFYCFISLVSLSLMSLLSHVYSVSVTEKNSLSLLPCQSGVFLSNKHYLSQQF